MYHLRCIMDQGTICLEEVTKKTRKKILQPKKLNKFWKACKKISLDCHYIKKNYIFLIGEVLEPILTTLVQKWFDNNIFPNSLKTAKGSLNIKKEMNSNLSTFIKNSLLPILDKLLKRLIYNRILDFVTSHDHLYELLRLLCKVIRGESDSVTFNQLITSVELFKLQNYPERVAK